MPNPAWRCGWDSGEGLGGEWALSLRQCDAAPECGISVSRAFFFAGLGRAAVLPARSGERAQHQARVCGILGV